MTDPYEVKAFGSDTSQRPIFMNLRMRAAWEATLAALDFAPLIVQGAYMARVPGGGATDSAGYHDAGGCIDTRTWDLTVEQERRLIKAARGLGWAVWKRDQRHGMDEHMHWVLLGDRDAASGARSQMAAYRAGRDGLDGGGSDYHWRPKPIPVFKFQEDDMPTPQDLLNAPVAKDVSLKKAVREMHKDVAALKKAFKEFRDNELTRDKKRAKETEARTAKVLAAIDAIEVPEGMTKQEFRDITREVVQAQLGKLDS